RLQETRRRLVAATRGTGAIQPFALRTMSGCRCRWERRNPRPSALSNPTSATRTNDAERLSDLMPPLPERSELLTGFEIARRLPAVVVVASEVGGSVDVVEIEDVDVDELDVDVDGAEVVVGGGATVVTVRRAVVGGVARFVV